MFYLFHIGLSNYKGQVVNIVVRELPAKKSLKENINQKLKRNHRPIITMKQLNDMILWQIVDKFRHHNYLFKVSEDLKEIQFILDLTEHI